jgi:hypothetical protein
VAWVSEAFYVLRPTPVLLAWSRERDVPPWMGLERPRLWTQREAGDHDYVGQGEAEQTFLKLAVLAHFMELLEISQASEADVDVMTQRVLAALLGPPPLTVETFDRWWSLERAESLSSVESTLAHTPVRTLRKVRGPEDLGARVGGSRAPSGRLAPRPVGEWWANVLRDREEDGPRLQCAVGWVLKHLEGMTPHRACALWVQPFSLDAPVARVLHVPGWTLSRRSHELREGITLTLEDFTWADEAWTFNYKVYSGARRPTSSGSVRLLLEKGPNGWAVQAGTWQP